MLDSSAQTRTSPALAGIQGIDADATPQELLQDPRVRAMLDMIAHAEGTGDRYDQTFGYRTIDDLSWHPNIKVTAGGYTSTAAGRYQFLSGTWEGVARQLDLPDFSPHSQDLAAVQLMKQRGMIEPLLQGNFAAAVHAGAPEWASLPTTEGGSYYGQPSRSLSELTGVYDRALQHHSEGTAPVPTPTPRPEPPAAPDGADPAPLESPATTAAQAAYRVQSGDTLWNVARSHGLELGNLLALPGNAGFNANPDLIFRGDVVHLPEGALAQYRVAAGDTLSGIATRHFMDLGAMIAANPQFAANGARDPDLIHPGETLRLAPAALPTDDGAAEPAPVDASPQATAPEHVDAPAQATHTYAPFTVYSGGRPIDAPGDVNPHHSDSGGRVRDGQLLIPRDVVLEAPGQSRLATTIPSPVSGTVVDTGTGIAQHQNGHGGRGNYVVLETDAGDRVHLFHLTSVEVSPGERIAFGQPLGTQGNTGASQGAHVHIESSPQIFERWVSHLLTGRFDD